MPTSRSPTSRWRTCGKGRGRTRSPSPTTRSSSRWPRRRSPDRSRTLVSGSTTCSASYPRATEPAAGSPRLCDRDPLAILLGSHGAVAQLGVLGEEEGDAPGSAETRLIIDPIDGTRNFVRGIPVFATLVAIETGGEVVAGVASAPALAARWHAARGSGAFRDGRRIVVSRIESLEHAMLFHGNLAPGEAGPPPGIAGLIARVERTRGFGDFLQHMLVAEGAGEVAIDPVMQPWDIAAPQVIVEEAGGRATGLGGERSIYAGSLVTSNGPLHETALRALAHPT